MSTTDDSPNTSRLTKTAPSLSPLDAILTSGRHRRAARKWPWAWWCTSCDDAYGAARTQPEAQVAADDHEHAAHGWTADTPAGGAA